MLKRTYRCIGGQHFGFGANSVRGSNWAPCKQNSSCRLGLLSVLEMKSGIT
jgi:hypothetical protein